MVSSPDRHTSSGALGVQIEGDLFSLTGDLDMWGGAKLLKLLKLAPVRPVRVDLAGVTFIDSLGLRALITSVADGDVSACVSPSFVVQRVLTVAGLEHLANGP